MKTYKLSYKKTINGAIQVKQPNKPHTHTHYKYKQPNVYNGVSSIMLERYRLRHEI